MTPKQTNDPFDFLYHFSDDEKAYLQKLGLPIIVPPHGERTYIGEVKSKHDDGYIKIWVTSCPANFYKFEVYCSETKETTIFQTGSGKLSDYYPFAYNIMDNTIAIKSITK